MTSFKDDVQDLKQSIQLVITAINQISLKLQNGKLIVYMTNLLLYASKYSWWGMPRYTPWEPVFRVSDKARLKPACSPTETS